MAHTCKCGEQSWGHSQNKHNLQSSLLGYLQRTLGKTYSIKCAAVGNIIINHLRTWWEHKEPYGIYLGTPNSKRISSPPPLEGKKWGLVDASCLLSLPGKDFLFLNLFITICGLSQWRGHLYKFCHCAVIMAPQCTKH